MEILLKSIQGTDTCSSLDCLKKLNQQVYHSVEKTASDLTAGLHRQSRLPNLRRKELWDLRFLYMGMHICIWGLMSDLSCREQVHSFVVALNMSC